MILKSTDYRQILVSEFERRHRSNRRYSLRAFSTRLGISVSTLSEVLNGKLGLSRPRAEKIAERLAMNEIERDYFVSLVESCHARSRQVRERAQVRLQNIQRITEKPLQIDAWTFISEWYHLAIVELARTRGFQSRETWIAKKLELDPITVRTACERLIRLGILERKGGKLKTTGQWLLTSPHDTPSAYTRAFHAAILAKAQRSIEEQSPTERNLSSLVVAINKEKIPEAKKLIMDFNRKLNKLLSADDQPENLYCFSTQLFSLEKGDEP